MPGESVLLKKVIDIKMFGINKPEASLRLQTNKERPL